MDEGRRQAYLAALGVDLYLARQSLPHAAPSWLAEWEAEARWEDDPTLAHDDGDAYSEAYLQESAAAVAPNAPASSATRPAIDALTARTAPANAAQRNAEPAVPVAPLTVPVLRNLKPEASGTTSVAPPKPQTMRVGLAVFEWPGQLRVLIEMADADAPSLSSREHRLWNEIALAMYGREQAYEAQSIPVFRFPPTPRMKSLETPDAVRDAVEGFLQARQARSTVALQVMFAGHGLAAAYTGSVGAQVQEPLQVDMGDAGTRLLLPSLSQLLEDACLKAPVWRALASALQRSGLRA